MRVTVYKPGKTVFITKIYDSCTRRNIFLLNIPLIFLLSIIMALLSGGLSLLPSVCRINGNCLCKNDRKEKKRAKQNISCEEFVPKKIRLIYPCGICTRLIRYRNNLGQHPKGNHNNYPLPDYIYRLLKPLPEKFWMLSFSSTVKESH